MEKILNTKFLVRLLALFTGISTLTVSAQTPTRPDPLDPLSPATAVQRLSGDHLVYVNQPNGTVDIGVKDLSVKVRGGYVVIQPHWALPTPSRNLLFIIPPCQTPCSHQRAHCPSSRESTPAPTYAPPP